MDNLTQTTSTYNNPMTVKSKYGMFYFDLKDFDSRSRLYMKILELKQNWYILSEEYIFWKIK